MKSSQRNRPQSMTKHRQRGRERDGPERFESTRIEAASSRLSAQPIPAARGEEAAKVVCVGRKGRGLTTEFLGKTRWDSKNENLKKTKATKLHNFDNYTSLHGLIPSYPPHMALPTRSPTAAAARLDVPRPRVSPRPRLSAVPPPTRTTPPCLVGPSCTRARNNPMPRPDPPRCGRSVCLPPRRRSRPRPASRTARRRRMGARPAAALAGVPL